MIYYTKSAEETERLAAAMAQRLQPGDVVAFYGGLGAGKTAFTCGLARGLGIKEAVTSPTYTIVNEYLSGRLPLFHFDMYRLQSAQELFDLGWDEYLERGGVCVVEWSERVEDALEDPICVRIEAQEEESSRAITIEGGGRFADLSI